jgi:hypothetical protein
MSDNKFYAEKIGSKQVSAPADLNGAAVTGARVSTDTGSRVAVELSFGASAAATIDVSFQQHDAAAGGNSKALTIQGNYYVKSGADTKFTKTEIRPDDSGLSDSVSLAADFGGDGSAGGIVVFDFPAEFLDANGGFNHLSVNVADSTAIKIMSGVYHVSNVDHEPAYDLDL